MEIGMVGLGRMGANMTRRLLQAGHRCVAYDASSQAVAVVAADGAVPAESLPQFVSALTTPRVIWLMLPAAVVGPVLDMLAPMLSANDIVVDGGNSEFRVAIERARRLQERGVYFVDVGTSGGVWGLTEGYCLMAGGEASAVQRLTPIFEALAPPPDAEGNRGYLHCGGPGAGHFVKMVHNGIEYSLMAAYAEGFNLLAQANRGDEHRSADAETAPLADAESYRYNFDVPAIASLWRQGSVVRSWLLDLTATALKEDPDLSHFAGRVSDSGEGRWALKAAVDLGVPMPELANALFARYSSRGKDDYANRLLSAMRKQFGGHGEKK